MKSKSEDEIIIKNAPLEDYKNTTNIHFFVSLFKVT